MSETKKSVKILDFIGNYINADKIIDYLSSYGESISLEELQTKPIFLYENGCKINFEQAAIDIISILTNKIYSDELLLDEFFNLYTKLGRSPTISEIQANGKYKVKEYLEKYGNWNNFIDRIKSKDPEIELQNLEAPGNLKNEELEEYANLLDNNSSEFMEKLNESLVLLKKIENAFRSLCRRRRESLLDTLNDYVCACKNTTEILKEITLILGLRFESPQKLSFRLSTNKADEQLGEAIVKNLSKFYNSKNSYIFPRRFIRLIPLFKEYNELIKSYGLTNPENDVEILNMLYEITLKIQKDIIDFRLDADEILSGIEMD